MRQALHIFLKDSRQFRYPIAGLLLWTALFGLNGHPWPDVPGVDTISLFDLLLTRLATFIFPIAWCYLIAQVIQADALAGERQFWLTRPYHRGSLAGAKAMFVLAYLTIPLMLAQIAIMVVSEVPLWPHIGGLIWNQILLAIVIVLPAAALAAVTSTLAQFILTALLVPALLLVTGARFIRPWAGLEWTRFAAAGAVLTGLALAVLVLQFWRRQTGTSKRVALFGALATALLALTLPFEAAFALQSHVTGEWHGVLRAELEAPQPPRSNRESGLEDRVQLFFRVTGVPPEQLTVCEAREVTLDLPRESWTSGVITGSLPLSPEGYCAVGLPVPRRVFEAVGDGHVRLRAVLYNTILGAEQVTPVSVGLSNPVMTDAGVCLAWQAEKYAYLRCRAAFREPGQLRWAFSTRDTYSPFPLGPRLQPVLERARTVIGRPASIPVITREPLGHVRIDVTAENVRLRDYQFGR